MKTKKKIKLPEMGIREARPRRRRHRRPAPSQPVVSVNAARLEALEHLRRNLVVIKTASARVLRELTRRQVDARVSVDVGAIRRASEQARIENDKLKTLNALAITKFLGGRMFK